MADFWLVINGGTTEEFSSITDAQVAAKGYVNQHIDVELHVNTTLTEEMALNATTSDFGGIPVYFEQGCGDTKRFDAFRIAKTTVTTDLVVTTNGATFSDRLSGAIGNKSSTTLGKTDNTSSVDGDITLNVNDSTVSGMLVNNVQAYVTGNSNINVNGGTIKNNVYGANYYSQVGGNISISLIDATLSKSGTIVFGTNRSHIGGTVEVSALRVTGGSICGSFSGSDFSKYTNSQGVTVNVTDSNMEWVCGGYSDQTVSGAIAINITGSTITDSGSLGSVTGFTYTVKNSAVHITINNSVLSGTVFGGDRYETSGSYVTVGDIDVSLLNTKGTSIYGTRRRIIAGTVSVSLEKANLSGDIVMIDGGTATNTELVLGTSSNTNTRIKVDVAGGGYHGKVTGTATVKLEGGTVNSGKNVYGGGYYANATVGSTEIYIKAGTAKQSYVYGNVYGGGRGGDVDNNTQIKLSAGTVAGSIYGAGTSYSDSETAAENGICLVGGNTTINITGGRVKGNVYGGGELGSNVTGTATVSITGGVFASSCRVFGGGNLTVAGTYNQKSNVTLNKAVSIQRLSGGALANGAAYTLSGDTSVTLTAGTVTQAIVGRANAYGGASVTDSGDTTISITGGQAHIVAGAGLVTAASTTYAYTGNTVINVSGGQIDYLFGGNVGSKKEFCAGTSMTGDVSITIDTSAKTVNLKYLYAGSNSSTGYEAAQEGNTTVTFTGNGDNLIWTEGGVSGDGSGKFADIDKSQGYSRTLCFNGFTGVFAAPQISRFDTIAFAGSSDVSFGSAALKLGGVETWQFGLGSSLTWNDGTNSFANDALIFGEAGDNISTDWEVMTSNNNKVFAGWGRANIMLFGTALDTYDADTLTWSAEGFGYVAKWDDGDHKIIIAQA